MSNDESPGVFQFFCWCSQTCKAFVLFRLSLCWFLPPSCLICFICAHIPFICLFYVNNLHMLLRTQGLKNTSHRRFGCGFMALYPPPWSLWIKHSSASLVEYIDHAGPQPLLFCFVDFSFFLRLTTVATLAGPRELVFKATLSHCSAPCFSKSCWRGGWFEALSPLKPEIMNVQRCFCFFWSRFPLGGGSMTTFTSQLIVQIYLAIDRSIYLWALFFLSIAICNLI